MTKSTVDDYSAATKLLERPGTYAEHPAYVERIDTHISSVFLTERFVYKLKKPVKFDFLDYSTSERRRWACEEEIRINRRLAEGVYLAVLPIVRTASGELRLDGDGEPVDWVVKMRRLPAEQTLEQLIRSGRIQPEHVSAISQRLRDFYRDARSLKIQPEIYCGEILRHVLANRAELLIDQRQLDKAMVKRIHTAQLRTLRVFPDSLIHRVHAGRIIDGHGDLRPDHIYLLPDPVVIDGIEFNAEFRHVDMLDELGFLAMECAAIGSDAIGQQIIDDYCTSSNDHPQRSLLRFYETYRACVRAKIAALRADQLSGDSQARSLDSCRNYLALADRFASELGPPMLILVWGLSGSGKSVLATELANQLGCDLLQTDAIRRELFGPNHAQLDFAAERYTEANRQRIYDTLFDRAIGLLDAGVSVVFDGTFLSSAHRYRAATLRPSSTIRFLSVHCSCSDEVAKGRIRQRMADGNSLSEFRPDLNDDQRHQLQPDAIPIPTCRLDTTESVASLVQQTLTFLRNV